MAVGCVIENPGRSWFDIITYIRRITTKQTARKNKNCCGYYPSQACFILLEHFDYLLRLNCECYFVSHYNLVPFSLNTATPYAVPIHKFPLMSYVRPVTVSLGKGEFCLLNVVHVVSCKRTKP